MWTMKINVSNAQYAALMEIHGPPENVNSMIMCCAPKAGKWTLEGDAKDFEDLLSVICLLYTSPSPRDATLSRMPSSA